MKKTTPAASPDAYVEDLAGWRRDLVDELRAAVRNAIKAGALNKKLGDPTMAPRK